MSKRVCSLYILLVHLPLAGWAQSPPTIPRELIDPVVTLGCMDYSAESRLLVKLPSVGFVIGDGSLILTAGHCFESFKTPPESSTRFMFAVSTYYGDLYPVTLIGHDPKCDLALLRVGWPQHPAFALGDPNELKPGHSAWIPSRPQFYTHKPYINTIPYLEKLTVERIDLQPEDSSITFTQTGMIQPGWSGSPVLLPSTNQIIGLMSEISKNTEWRAIFFKRTTSKAMACHLDSIEKLIAQYHCTEQAMQAPQCNLPPIPHSQTSFMHIQTAFNAMRAQDLELARDEIQQAVQQSPASGHLHLWLALLTAIVDKVDHQDEDRVVSLLETARNLAPQSSYIYAVSARLLMNLKEVEQAQEVVHTALSQDPNNALALHLELKLLHKKAPQQAIQSGQQLIAQEPNNSNAWYYTSLALLNDNQPEQALHAAQQAVAINPQGSLHEALALALTRLGRLDEACMAYQDLTKHCGCENCWYRYSRFLIQHYPDRTAEAQNALDQARSSTRKKGISSQRLDQLQEDIWKQSDSNQVHSTDRQGVS